MTSQMTSALAPMTERTSVISALNQLSSLIAGRDMAFRTKDRHENPIDRIGEMTSIVASEMKSACDPIDHRRLKVAQTKLESLHSLETLAKCTLDEVIWD